MMIQKESVKVSSRGEGFQVNPFGFINRGEIMLYHELNDIL